MDTLSGQPIVEKGHSPEENQVSRTSESRSSVNFLPGNLATAFSRTSSSDLPAIHHFPSFRLNQTVP
jgi:hypothetical protein